MPHWAPTIDVYLAEIDLLLFSYHWPDFVRANAANPITYEAMRYAYLSTLPQIACLLIVLGLSGRTREMYALMTTVTLAGTMTVEAALGERIGFTDEEWALIGPLFSAERGRGCRPV